MAASEPSGITLNCRKTLEITSKKQFLKRCLQLVKEMLQNNDCHYFASMV